MLAAAVEQFAEHGVAAVTVRQVATVAGVNPGLVHRYIGTKEDLVVRAMAEASRRVAQALVGGDQALDDRSGESPVERYERLLAHLALEDHDLEAMALDHPLMGFLVEQAARAEGLDDRAARLRAVSVVALDLGWRLFAPLVRVATGLDDDQDPAVWAALGRARHALLTRP